MKTTKIISPYFENGVFAGVRVTLGDEDFVIAKKDYRHDERLPYKLPYEVAMDILEVNNLTTWNYRQICFTMAFCKEINKVLKDNGGDKLDGAYWTGVEYSRTCSFSFYCDDVLGFDYKFLALRIRPIKNLKK